MNARGKRCACGHKEFDAEAAFRQLATKYDQLALTVATFMSNSAAGVAASTSDALIDNLTTIVGGVPITANEFPECCLIGSRRGNSTQWFCTGVLVHPRVVLTAGHCLGPDAPVNIVALRAATMSNLTGAEVIRARRAVAHPGFNLVNDIAVVILQTAATVATVPMATTAEIGGAFQTTLVGFGRNDIFSTRGFGVKRRVTVPITHVQRAATDDLTTAEGDLNFESDLEFVAGGGGFDSCNGDSGGPAYINVGPQRKVAGLTSRGTATAETPCGDGGIYTRVDKQLNFVRSVAADFGITL